MAVLVLAVVGTTVGAAFLLGTNQEDPAEASDAEVLAITGPPLVPDIAAINPSALTGGDPSMRLGVLDKDTARREERRARADARALRTLAAQQAAIYEFVAAMDAAARQAQDPTPSPAAPSTPADPRPTSGGGGGGGGGSEPPPPQPDPNDAPLYTKLDNIAMCESGQRPDAFNPRGPYWGAFQFHVDTWRSSGGGGDGTPRQRGNYILRQSYAAQREIAANLARSRGFAGSWPSCAARYGYT